MLIPFTKVQAVEGDRLLFNRKEGARPPTDDGWWDRVLTDDRARVPTEARLSARGPFARYRVDRHEGSTVFITCKCGWSGGFSRDELAKAWGPDMNILKLARSLAGCKSPYGKRDGPCMAKVL